LRSLVKGPIVSAFKRPSYKSHRMVVMMKNFRSILKCLYSLISRHSLPDQHSIKHFVRLESGDFNGVKRGAHINLKSRSLIL
jgi:hypothetical protein